jgi:hypothetical protein
LDWRFAFGFIGKCRYGSTGRKSQNGSQTPLWQQRELAPWENNAKMAPPAVYGARKEKKINS